MQYQQLIDLQIAQTGYWEFQNVVLESTTMLLLDVQSDPQVQHFAGLESVTMIDFQSSDSTKTNYADIQNLNSVIQLNCSQLGCTLDGVTIISASADGSPYNEYRVGHAVHVFAGHVQSVTVLDSSHSGALDVVDSKGVPFSSFVSKTEGGLLLVGESCSDNCSDTQLSQTATNPMPNNNNNLHTSWSSSHSLLFGLSSETTGRLALDTDSSIKWGAGQGSSFDMTLHRTLTNSTYWNLPLLSTAAPRAKFIVKLADVVHGDVVAVSHTGINGEQDIELSGAASEGHVVVRLHLVGEEVADVSPRLLHVMAGQWSGEGGTHHQPLLLLLPLPAPQPPALTPSAKKQLLFHKPAVVDSGSGWGDTLHSLY